MVVWAIHWTLELGLSYREKQLKNKVILSSTNVSPPEYKIFPRESITTNTVRSTHLLRQA